ncbi:MAG: Eco57I restriction-modification methylase domain-containing protein [Cytophagales bacterium]|nr:Eco57I restriction-modification methylase domain-containing protein [Cytophagales bacterium]
MIYGSRSNGKQHGLVLTKPIVVEKMLELVDYRPDKNLHNVEIVEPSAGDGAFAIPIINTLHASSNNHGFDFESSLHNLKFFEIDDQMYDSLSDRVCTRLKELGVTFPNALVEKGDFLTSNLYPVDIVIGNPPYVRYENIPSEKKNLYRKSFGTFTHRSDLYIAFFEKGLKYLKEDGVLSFICSNRWLKNQYGQSLRKYIHGNFDLKEIIDLENTSPFEEDVVAYPAIVNIKNARSEKKSKYYKLNDISNLEKFSRSNEPERTLNTAMPNWFMKLNNGQAHYRYLDTIDNQGFKIGIGVATGCDSVFIRNDFREHVEKELLLPILTSKDLKGDNFKWGGNYILNPFDQNGRLIDLKKYPRARNYFCANEDLLRKRHVSQKNNSNWYRTIDKINYKLTFIPKIILPDITGNRFIFIDDGDYYPHHNLYYIMGKDKRTLKVLATILMSDFVKEQLLELGNKMNGGYPRWQSQNIKKLRVPLINAMPASTIEELIEAYENRDFDSINNLITPNEISKYEITVGQTVLFEPNERGTYVENT